jgi:hypothetical protein
VARWDPATRRVTCGAVLLLPAAPADTRTPAAEPPATPTSGSAPAAAASLAKVRDAHPWLGGMAGHGRCPLLPGTPLLPGVGCVPVVAYRSSPPPGKQGFRGRAPERNRPFRPDRERSSAGSPTKERSRRSFGGSRPVAERGRLRGDAAPADLCGPEGSSGTLVSASAARRRSGPEGRMCSAHSCRDVGTETRSRRTVSQDQLIG